MTLSIIIPAWNDAENIAALLPRLAGISGISQTIVVGDAASEDLARSSGALFCRVEAPSRGAQMNAGAARASGDVLVFLHADTELHAAHIAAVQRAMREPRIVGGAFYRKFDERHPRLIFLEPVARLFTRNGGILFGDQTVFARRTVFESLGGFADIPLMEDVEFSRRLRRAGRVTVLDPPIGTSPRRHLRNGAWRTTAQNALFLLLYKLGIPPQRLHAWYYGGTNGPASSPAARP